MSIYLSQSYELLSACYSYLILLNSSLYILIFSWETMRVLCQNYFPFKYVLPSALAVVVTVSFKCCSVVELTPRSMSNPKLNSNIEKQMYQLLFIFYTSINLSFDFTENWSFYNTKWNICLKMFKHYGKLEGHFSL